MTQDKVVQFKMFTGSRQTHPGRQEKSGGYHTVGVFLSEHSAVSVSSRL